MDIKKNHKWFVCIPIVFLCYILFFIPEKVFEEHCPDLDKPYSLEVVKYGTGFFGKKTALIHYKIDGKKVGWQPLVIFGDFSKSIDVVWDTSRYDSTWWIDKHVLLTMTTDSNNSQSSLSSKYVEFDYNSVRL